MYILGFACNIDESVLRFMVGLAVSFLNSVLRIESKHEVTIMGGLNEFSVKFYGPKNSEY